MIPTSKIYEDIEIKLTKQEALNIFKKNYIDELEKAGEFDDLIIKDLIKL
jgi:hypothetical protein